MKHSDIAATAIVAATAAAQHLVDKDVGSFAEQHQLPRLYDYARERQFPLPETLARKTAEFVREPFPFSSIVEAPEALRVFFTTFRAVAEALEPFHEDDPVESPTEAELPAGDTNQEEKSVPTQTKSDPATPGPDDVAARTAEGQAAMSKAIAESGGQFSKPAAPDAAETETAKKKNK